MTQLDLLPVEPETIPSEHAGPPPGEIGASTGNRRELAPFLLAALREDSGMVEAALMAQYVTLADLTPTCPVHVQAIQNVADRNGFEGNEIPRAWLERFSSYHLWRNAQQHRSVAAFLADAIRGQDWSHPFWEEIPRDRHTDFPNCCLSIQGPFPAVIADAFLEKCRAHPHVRPISEAIKANWIPEARKELDCLLEQARSRHTAAQETAEATRLAKQKQARLQSRRASAERRKNQDTLHMAITSGEAHRVNRFALENLTPERITELLPVWLAAPAQVQSCLLRVPKLDPAIQVEALTAWSTIPTPTRPKLPTPVAKSLLTSLSGHALGTLLQTDLTSRDHTTVTPRITLEDLTTLLLPIAISDPTKAQRIHQGYRHRDWHEELKVLASHTAVGQPTDPEATWVRHLTKTHAYDGSALVRRAATVYRLYQDWDLSRRTSLAAPLAEWMETVPYILGEGER